MESACLRPQFASGRGAAGADAADPGPRREQEERRERQCPTWWSGSPTGRSRTPPGSNATTLAVRTHSSLRRLTIRPPSNAHFCTALAISVLALLSFSPDLTVFFASNSVPGRITLSAIPTAAAHRVYLDPFGPMSARPRTFHCSSLTCLQLDHSAFGEIEQRRGEAVLGNAFGADVLGLHRSESCRRRVLQRKSRRRFDGGAAPQERAERGRDGEARDPEHTGHRLAQDSVPGVRPRQAGLRRRGHVDAGAHRDRSARPKVGGRQLDRVSRDRQILAGPARRR